MKDGLEECLQTLETIEQNRSSENIERMSEDGTFDVLPRRSCPVKEENGIDLRRTLAESKGDMKTLPDAIFRSRS